jgi:hypothetical protein
VVDFYAELFVFVDLFYSTKFTSPVDSHWVKNVYKEAVGWYQIWNYLLPINVGKEVANWEVM